MNQPKIKFIQFEELKTLMYDDADILIYCPNNQDKHTEFVIKKWNELVEVSKYEKPLVINKPREKRKRIVKYEK